MKKDPYKVFLYIDLFITKKNPWQWPIFAYTIVGTEELNFWVRDGIRCTLFVIITKEKLYFNSSFKTKIMCFKLEFINKWLNPRSISTGQLNISLCFHLQPINLVVFKGSYFKKMGKLILRLASRLDAFSVYPFPT